MLIGKVYTKSGDKGKTRIAGGHIRPKDDLRVATYGTTDELCSLLGIVLLHPMTKSNRAYLIEIQHDLFTVGGDLCVLLEDQKKRTMLVVEKAMITKQEKAIDRMNKALKPMKDFNLAGGTPAAVYLHYARTVCRRAERLVVSLSKKEKINPLVITYLNRLSDLLFVMSRYENEKKKKKEVVWDRQNKLQTKSKRKTKAAKKKTKKKGATKKVKRGKSV